MKEVISDWRLRVNDRQNMIKYLTALNHYKKTLLFKYFNQYKN